VASSPSGRACSDRAVGRGKPEGQSNRCHDEDRAQVSRWSKRFLTLGMADAGRWATSGANPTITASVVRRVVQLTTREEAPNASTRARSMARAGGCEESVCRMAVATTKTTARYLFAVLNAGNGEVYGTFAGKAYSKMLKFVRLLDQIVHPPDRRQCCPQRPKSSAGWNGTLVFIYTSPLPKRRG
jgi:hypothetical protein